MVVETNMTIGILYETKQKSVYIAVASISVHHIKLHER